MPSTAVTTPVTVTSCILFISSSCIIAQFPFDKNRGITHLAVLLAELEVSIELPFAETAGRMALEPPLGTGGLTAEVAA
jgi:hypothetical protein